MIHMINDTTSLDARTFHILVVLAAGALHGYAIRQEVEERTSGEIRLWPATLYGQLADLTQRGWIEETAAPAAEAEDGRGRRWYVLTAAGRATLAAEATRLEELVRIARRRLELGEAT